MTDSCISTISASSGVLETSCALTADCGDGAVFNGSKDIALVRAARKTSVDSSAAESASRISAVPSVFELNPFFKICKLRFS